MCASMARWAVYTRRQHAACATNDGWDVQAPRLAFPFLTVPLTSHSTPASSVAPAACHRARGRRGTDEPQSPQSTRVWCRCQGRERHKLNKTRRTGLWIRREVLSSLSNSGGPSELEEVGLPLFCSAAHWRWDWTANAPPLSPLLRPFGSRVPSHNYQSVSCVTDRTDLGPQARPIPRK